MTSAVLGTAVSRANENLCLHAGDSLGRKLDNNEQESKTEDVLHGGKC